MIIDHDDNQNHERQWYIVLLLATTQIDCLFHTNTICLAEQILLPTESRNKTETKCFSRLVRQKVPEQKLVWIEMGKQITHLNNNRWLNSGNTSKNENIMFHFSSVKKMMNSTMTMLMKMM